MRQSKTLYGKAIFSTSAFLIFNTFLHSPVPWALYYSSSAASKFSNEIWLKKILFFFSVLIITAGTFSRRFHNLHLRRRTVIYRRFFIYLRTSHSIDCHHFQTKKEKLTYLCLLLYSPTLSFSAYQWVDWNTKLFAPEVTKIQGWNFKVSEWKWIDLEKNSAKRCNCIQLVATVQRFAVKTSAYDYLDDRETADILFNVEMINGKLLITDATHVWWQSSGETGVWPTR